jgi:sRNA-binding carbon storage regulator CsrA
MALILAAQQNESVFIGDVKLTVINILSPSLFKVKVWGEAFDTIFTIRSSERVEVLPDVFLSAGNTGSMEHVKMVFEAPKDRIILRERLYRRDHRDARV